MVIARWLLETGVPSGNISKRSVDALAAEERDSFLWDDELRGFGAKVTPAGAKSYVFQFRLGGREAKTRRYTIGKHGSPWTPAGARTEAERLAHLVSQGIDPIIAEKQRREKAVDLEFTSYAARFIAANRGEGARSYEAAEGAVRLYLAPAFAGRTLTDIHRSDVAAMLDRLPDGKVALRRNVFAVLRRLFRWAVQRGSIERSPIELMEVPAAPPSRDRVLSDAELAIIWQASDELGYPFGPLVHLLIATGQRRDEVASLDWRELNREAAEWTLPAARSKNKLAHVVPLNALAVAVLDSVAGTGHSQKWPGKGLVFSTNGRTSVSGYSRAKRRLDAAIARRGDSGSDVTAWRVHDIRRTVATGLQRLGVRFEVTEAVLNHVSGARSGIAGVYQRYDWKAEKRAALDAWSAHASRLFTGADGTNVVPIAAAAGAA